MEVRHEQVDDLPVEPAVDEEGRVTRQWPAGRGFERADTRGTDGNDAARGGTGVERLGRHAVLLAMDDVILGAVRDDRTERVESHHQLDGAHLDVTSAASLEEARREVQPRGGCRDGTGTGGVHRLIPLGIVERRVDVGRQRHRSVTVECVERIVREESHSHAAGVIEPLAYLHRELVARGMHRAQHLADAESPRRAHERVPPSALEGTHEEDLDVATRRAAHSEPRRDDARVVHDEHVTGLEQVREVGNGTMVRSRRRAAVDEQASRVARLGRNLRDARRRQVVLERPHGRCLVSGHRGGMVVAGSRVSIQVYGPRMAITTRTDQLTAHDGGTFDGHVWLPDAGSGPGLLLLQEIFGVGPYVRSVAERLAAQGYVVLAPDVFWRVQRNWEADHDEKGLTDSIGMMGKFDFVQGVDDCVAAFEHLDEMSEVTRGTGVIGFCMGGLLTYHVAAATEPQVAVSYYGSNIASSLDLSGKITCPIIFHFGERDAYIPMEQVDQIRVAFANRDDAPVHVHDAGHAFDNHEAPMFFDPEAAKAAWAITSEFLSTHLPV